MHENAQKVEWKMWLSHGYSMVKIAGLDDAFSELFELKENPVRKEKEKKERRKKSYKIEKPKEGHFLV